MYCMAGTSKKQMIGAYKPWPRKKDPRHNAGSILQSIFNLISS